MPDDTVRNVLIIMADQLRADYLGCYGHPTIKTPNIDALAARGVMFNRAYAASPSCGPARMSVATGRYPSSHGSIVNYAPLRLDELTLGDHLRELGVRTTAVGRTHVIPNRKAMERFGVEGGDEPWATASRGGYEPYWRFGGIVPSAHPDPGSVSYNEELHARGYEADNPWHDNANAGRDREGKVLSGWLYENADKPAALPERDSESHLTTDIALRFIGEARDEPWCLHLGYIKPHWPYIAPEPYHDMYSKEDVLQATRSSEERISPHPVIGAFARTRESAIFAKETVRQRVIPTYMGLVSQIDDEIGRIVEYLEIEGKLDSTMIIFTSDHGDMLGDHWLGEKDVFFEAAARVPLIVVDPTERANETRGRVDNRLIEAIDLVPTLIEWFGGEPDQAWLEGQSLMPAITGEHSVWRNAVFAEIDYSPRRVHETLGVDQRSARGAMIRTDRWKYISWVGFPPQLFEMNEDPDELLDLAGDPEYAAVCAELQGRLLEWMMTRKVRVGLSDERLDQLTGDNQVKRGILVGFWNEKELRTGKPNGGLH